MYVYIYIYIHTYIYMYSCIYTYTCMYIYAYIHVCIYVYMYTYMCACEFVSGTALLKWVWARHEVTGGGCGAFIFIHMYVYVHIFEYIHLCICPPCQDAPGSLNTSPIFSVLFTGFLLLELSLGCQFG